MIETILSLAGGAIGSIIRLVPEVMKIMEAGAERKHEIAMTKIQMEIDQKRSELAIDKVHAKGFQDELAGQMKAYISAVKGQHKQTGIKWVDALSASVRPFITYWWMVLFTLYKVTAIIAVWGSSASLTEFSEGIWTHNDWGILSMILGFWFVDRVMRHNGK